MENFKVNPAYLEIGKALAMQLGTAYASINPAVGLGVTVAKTIFDTQAAIARQNDILARAQFEGWTDTDPRWDAVLAEQEARMATEDARHKELRG